MRTVIESRPRVASRPWPRRSNTGRRKATRRCTSSSRSCLCPQAWATTRWTAPSNSSCPWAERRVAAVDHLQHAAAVARSARRLSGACLVGHAQGGVGPRPVRLGTHQRADGAMVPMWHDSKWPPSPLPCKTSWPAAWPSRSSNPCRWTSLKRPLVCRPRWQERSAVNAARTP